MIGNSNDAHNFPHKSLLLNRYVVNNQYIVNNYYLKSFIKFLQIIHQSI